MGVLMTLANKKPVLILNGPNLNLLGQREPGVYGAKTLDDVRKDCEIHVVTLGGTADFRQSNHEGQLVDWLHEAHSSHCGVIINAGAYTHTSIALHDAIKGIGVPVIELHISNIHARETFRHHSAIAAACVGQICGFGTSGYTLALQAMHDILASRA